MSQDVVLRDIKDLHLNGNSSQCLDGYHILAEHALSLEKVYIVDLSVKRFGDDIKCAIAQSENGCEVYQLSQTQFKLIASFTGHTNQITNVRFSPESDSVVYSSSLDGKIKVWDLRNGDCVRELKDADLKPLSSMDVSCRDRILCAGTEIVEGDAFLLFWDIRSKKLLGGYWESHTDDITNVSFHPTDPDTVASSSTDGLVNIFDLKEQNEDDALQTSLNTESSVARTRWHDGDLLSVLTHTETVQLWERDGAAPMEHWSRQSIGSCLEVSADDCYSVNIHSRAGGEMFLVAGSNAGKGDCLKAVPIENGKLLPGVPLVGNRQIIRSSQYIPELDILFTGGESGCLCAWRSGEEKIGSHPKKNNKPRNKLKHKPY